MADLALDDYGMPVLLAPRRQPSPPDDLELTRRRDAVREAAREFEDLGPQDLRERLRGTTTRELTTAEHDSFARDVRAQVLDDLVDVLDQRQRGRLRRRRTVRILAPRGYVRMVVTGLDDGEREHVKARLVARGWGAVDVQAVVPGRSSP